ncbi:basic salivary proline-rich protein 1-like [Lemur catta]|uniref:basic salivary proline-rich protein 1-like n=1 Tax=Lemur catta TaxID=9447 RepID=UPI001E266731|nr:basic salivary proline-rich protein 1-like [Lemur catta]
MEWQQDLASDCLPFSQVAPGAWVSLENPPRPSEGPWEPWDTKVCPAWGRPVAGRESELPRTPDSRPHQLWCYCLVENVNPLSPHPMVPQSPPQEGTGRPGGRGNPQDEETRERWPRALTGRPPTSEVGGGPGPLPPPRPTQALPPHTQPPSPGELGATCRCSHPPRGGRREGQPLGDPPPWGSLEDGADTSGQSASPCPPGPIPVWLRSSWYPSTLSLKAGFGHIIPPWSTSSPLPHQLLFPTSGAPSGWKTTPPTGNSPPFALVEPVRPPTHLPIRPSVRPPVLVPI